ncbi:MAG: ribbon-helix-helix domain-containing protein [Arenicellales bacterium]
MCKVFINADPELWSPQSRSLRLHGAATSVRLETLYWRVLEEIGERDGMNVNQLITTLHDELLEARGEVSNFASFLRVCCARYLMLQVAGRIPADLGVPIRSLDPDYVLAGEHFPARGSSASSGQLFESRQG